MRIYRHRINDVAALRALPEGMGLEFDLQSQGGRIVIAHDPGAAGPDMEPFMAALGTHPSIFNVKSAGIEDRVLQCAAEHGVRDFFLLDQSIPASFALRRKGERRMAIRCSEVEPVEFARAWIGHAEWVWMDCFTRYPERPVWDELHRHFRICVVAPELEGHVGPAAEALRGSLAGFPFDAVCTKRPEDWEDAP